MTEAIPIKNRTARRLRGEGSRVRYVLSILADTCSVHDMNSRLTSEPHTEGSERHSDACRREFVA